MRRERLALAAAWALGPLLALLVGLCVANAPMYDEWIWSPLVLAQHAGSLRFEQLWAPEGAHRSLVPVALALLLARFDGWNVRVEALLSVVIALLTQALLWRLLVRRCGARAPAAFLAASLLLFSLVQSENWWWGFQLSWFIVNLCAVAVVAALADDDGIGVPARFAAALLAAAAASFSLIFGFAAWASGAVVLLARRAWLRLTGWCATGLAVAALFLHGYAPPRFENGWIAGAPQPWSSGVQFVLAELGAPLGLAGGRALCELLGAALVLAAAALAWRNRGRGAAPWLALVAFALVAAAMEAVGRGGNGIDAALAFRYTTPSSLAWIGLAGLIAGGPPLPMRRAVRVAAAVTAVLFVVENGAGAFEALQLSGMQGAAREALRDLGAHDDEELAEYENDPAFLRAQAAALAAAGLGPWRDPAFSRRPESSPRASSQPRPDSAR